MANTVKEHIDFFLEDIEREYKEATIRKQLSPEARKQVDLNKAGHKELSSTKLAFLNQVTSKDFHLKSPQDKHRIAQELGFGNNTQAIPHGQSKVIKQSWLNPDLLYGASNRLDNTSGQTFIYKYDTDKLYSLDAQNSHHLLEKTHKEIDSANRMDQRLYSQINGRVVDIPEDTTRKDIDPFRGMNDKMDDTNQNVSSGVHMSLWTFADEEQIDNIIKNLPANLKPDFIHLPEDWRDIGSL